VISYAILRQAIPPVAQVGKAREARSENGFECLPVFTGERKIVFEIVFDLLMRYSAWLSKSIATRDVPILSSIFPFSSVSGC